MMANCFEQFKMKKIVVIHNKINKRSNIKRDSSASFIINNEDENGKIQFFLPSKINNNNNAEEVTELRNGLHY